MDGKDPDYVHFEYSGTPPRGLMAQYDALSGKRARLGAERVALEHDGISCDSAGMRANLKDLRAVEVEWAACRAEILRQLEVADEHRPYYG